MGQSGDGESRESPRASGGWMENVNNEGAGRRRDRAESTIATFEPHSVMTAAQDVGSCGFSLSRRIASSLNLVVSMHIVLV